MGKHDDEYQGSGDKAAEDRGDRHDQFDAESALSSGRGGQVHGGQRLTNQPGAGAGGSGGQGGGSQGGGGQGNLNGE